MDTGVGMSAETRRLCLEPFFTTKGERGTGLGLAMVYGALQRHGATVEIDSAPGAGTTDAAGLRPATPGGRDRRGESGAARRTAPGPVAASSSWTTTRCCSSRCATPWRPTATS